MYVGLALVLLLFGRQGIRWPKYSTLPPLAAKCVVAHITTCLNKFTVLTTPHGLKGFIE